MFRATKNLVTLTMEPCLPWDFKSTTALTPQIRGDKHARQEFYRSTATEHCFYSPLEGSNPNMRVSKENPPRLMHALTVDYDVRIPEERVKEAVAALAIKPAWIERSLGGNVRLIWTFPEPIRVDSYEFCCFVLERTIKWLNLGILPGLDENAVTTPTRLLCNGCDWKPTGHPAISEKDLQAFFVECAKKFNFKGLDGPDIPLDVVEAGLKVKYPTFSWPSDFILESQGPSFWLPESTSPMSAILKEEGILTFAAHAAKTFYTWTDLLGPEFVKDFITSSIAKATKNIFWDGKRFWRRKKDGYASLEMPELNNYFRVNCRLSAKPGKEGTSPIDDALNFIYLNAHVSGAAPFMFKPEGIMVFQSRPVLNTYISRFVPPAPESADAWSEKFPFIARLIDQLFDPPDQKMHLLAWLKRFYTCAVESRPLSGQSIVLMGQAGIGKTCLNRAVIGHLMGSHVDASSFLARGEQFNSELFDSPLWCVDDETASESIATQNSFSAMLKKVAANGTFRHNKKFEVAVMVEWLGRIIVTANVDYVSSRILGPMDNTSLDKISLFRCALKKGMDFPTSIEIEAIIKNEAPWFGRWLLDYTPPDFVKRDSRFGFEAHHDSMLLEQVHHGSRSAPFREMLLDSLQVFFETNPKATEWRGTGTNLCRLIFFNPLNEIVSRGLKLEQMSRYLEIIQREGSLPCKCETDKFNQRVWVFERF